jgi:O-antigen/teichoic acid export membrane protein
MARRPGVNTGMEEGGGVRPDDILDLPEAGPTVIRGGFLRVLGFAAGVLVSVGSAAVLLRYLSVADFGRYTQVIALVSIVMGLTDAGMTSIGVREYSVRERSEARALVRNLLGMRLVLTLIGIAIALCFAAAAGYTAAMLGGVALGGCALLFQVAQGTIGVPLQSGLRLGWVTGIELLRQAGTTLLIVAAVVAGAGIVVVFAAPLPVAVVLLLLTAWVVRGQVSLAPAFELETWRWLSGLVLPFAAATAVGVIYVYVSVVLMSVVSTERETGIFGASFRVFTVIAVTPGLLVMTAFPVLARAARDDRYRLGYAVQRLFEVCVIAGAGIALVTVIAAPTLIAILAGDKYAAAVPVLRVHGIALLASFLVALGGFALLALRRHRGLLIANGAALATSLALTLALAPGHGALGTAYANLAGETVLAAGYFLALALGEDGTRISLELMPRVAVAAAAGVAVALIPLPPVVAALLAGAAYAAGLVVLRAVPKEIFEALRPR